MYWMHFDPLVSFIFFLSSHRLRHPQTWAIGWASYCHRPGARQTPKSWCTTTSTPRGSPASSLLPRLPYSEILASVHLKGHWSRWCVHTWAQNIQARPLCAFVCLCSLMQRRYSEPNTYIDTPPSIPHNSEELYDDVASIADPEVRMYWIKMHYLETQKVMGIKLRSDGYWYSIHLR